MRSRALLAGVEEAREVVRPGRGAAGLLVMSLPVSFGLAQLAPVFPALLEKHPRLEFDLRFEDSIRGSARRWRRSGDSSRRSAAGQSIRGRTQAGRGRTRAVRCSQGRG